MQSKAFHRVRCPGCGLTLPRTNAPADGRFSNSAECWQMYGELSAYTWSLFDADFIHQHAVDAYSAQHAGENSKPITVVFALIGLYLALERGFNGRQVQRAHMLLAKNRIDWPTLAIPKDTGHLTVAHPMSAAPGTPRNEALLDWCASVWQAWDGARPQVIQIVQDLLDRQGRPPGNAR